MEDRLGEVRGAVPDLNNVRIAEFRHWDSPELEFCVNRMLEQVDRPRNNIGDGGPPGRVD